MKLGLCFLSLATLALVACSEEATEEAPAAIEGPYGDFVRVDVSGRGVVSSNPTAIYCGNDGDQRRCDGEFLFEKDPEQRPRVTLEAKEYPDWSFKEWVVTTEGQIAYEPLEPEVDRTSPVLHFDPGTVSEPSGKARARRYRVTAVFTPIQTNASK